MKRWIGKSAVVTGASSGIGEVIAKSLTTAGMNVFGLARREDRLKELSNNLKNTKGSFQYLFCDVRNEEDILRAFGNVEKQVDGIDVLVNNAGLSLPGFLGDAKTETLRTVLDVNVLGAAICMREAIKSMRKRKTEGHIININSILGLMGSHFSIDLNIYSASKYALTAMTDTLEREIARNKDNIRITGIHPGVVKTEFVLHSGHGLKTYDRIPFIESEQIANCVNFALSAPPGTQVTQIVIRPLHEKI